MIQYILRHHSSAHDAYCMRCVHDEDDGVYYTQSRRKYLEREDNTISRQTKTLIAYVYILIFSVQTRFFATLRVTEKTASIFDHLKLCDMFDHPTCNRFLPECPSIHHLVFWCCKLSRTTTKCKDGFDTLSFRHRALHIINEISVCFWWHFSSQGSIYFEISFIFPPTAPESFLRSVPLYT